MAFLVDIKGLQDAAGISPVLFPPVLSVPHTAASKEVDHVFVLLISVSSASNT